jgi:hypothetical protein
MIEIFRPIDITTEEVFGLLTSSNRKSLSGKDMNHHLRQSVWEKFK